MRAHGSQWISHTINFRHSGQLKKWKSFWSYQHCQSSPFTSNLGQIGQIGSAVQLVAPKGLPGFWFFQLQWVPIIHFMWNPLSPMRAHFCHLIISAVSSVWFEIRYLPHYKYLTWKFFNLKYTNKKISLFMPELPRAHKLLKGFDSKKLENAELNSWFYWTGSLQPESKECVFFATGMIRVLKADANLDSGQHFIV